MIFWAEGHWCGHVGMKLMYHKWINDVGACGYPQVSKVSRDCCTNNLQRRRLAPSLCHIFSSPIAAVFFHTNVWPLKVGVYSLSFLKSLVVIVTGSDLYKKGITDTKAQAVTQTANKLVIEWIRKSVAWKVASQIGSTKNNERNKTLRKSNIWSVEVSGIYVNQISIVLMGVYGTMKSKCELFKKYLDILIMMNVKSLWWSDKMGFTIF